MAKGSGKHASPLWRTSSISFLCFWNIPKFSLTLLLKLANGSTGGTKYVNVNLSVRQDKDNFEIQAIKVNLTDIDATSKMWTQDEYIHGLLTRHFPFYLFRQEGIIFFPRTLMFLATHITLPLSLSEKEKRRAGENYESPISIKRS